LNAKRETGRSQEKEASSNSIISDALPDIYYIILDGYAHDSTLASAYNYKNNSLTAFLKRNAFYIADSSRTNYMNTSGSLGCSLNFDYAENIKEERPLYKSEVSKYLKKKGYRIVHLNSGYDVTGKDYYA